MIIHIRGADGIGRPSLVDQLIEKHNGRELFVGKRPIGWNLHDTIVVRSQGLTQAMARSYVEHFAPQRHVIFEDTFAKPPPAPYLAHVQRVSDYLFAFVDLRAEALRDQLLRRQCQAHDKLERSIRGAGCTVVKLRPDRAVPQVEALLLSARCVLGSCEPLAMPHAHARLPAVQRLKVHQAA
ncbi:MAG: hypothetical protein M3Z37_07190 [Candidatus Eremiobacteraeota bacterium]|nr:hypothetical protein [Candidatus Eremiobacteraeota bacterium]